MKSYNFLYDTGFVYKIGNDGITETGVVLVSREALDQHGSAIPCEPTHGPTAVLVVSRPANRPDANWHGSVASDLVATLLSPLADTHARQVFERRPYVLDFSLKFTGRPASK